MGAVLLAAMPVRAHHSLETEYDEKNPVTLRGTVTKVEWGNPHVRLYMDVAKAGTTANWELEMGSPNSQILRGWKIDSFRPGDHVVVKAYRARDGSNLGFARSIAKSTP